MARAGTRFLPRLPGPGGATLARLLLIGAALSIVPCAALAAQAEIPPPRDPAAEAERFVAALAAREFASAVTRFDGTMKGAMPEEKLRETWSALTQQVGAFQERLSTSVQPRGPYVVARVTCRFEKMTLDLQVTLDADGRVAGLYFVPTAPDWSPPAYDRPDAYTESEVTIGAEPWQLPGTLILPRGPGPFPALVLVHGSGPHDRDETIGPNKVFKDLAAGLAARGVAVLRYEKRTQRYAAKLASAGTGFTVKEESVDDAVAAVAALRRAAGVDPKRIFVLGHSLGGMVLPRIAAADPSIAGLVCLAGATRKIEDAIVAQVRYIAASAGTITPEARKKIDEATALAARIKALEPSDAARPEAIGGAPASYWLDLEAYDPVAAARGLRTPMLILQGERDYQVTLEDFGRWKAGLGARGNVTFMTYPTLNHLFIAGTGKSLPAEYDRPGHVAEQVIADIAAWVGRQPGAPAAGGRATGDAGTGKGAAGAAPGPGGPDTGTAAEPAAPPPTPAGRPAPEPAEDPAPEKEMSALRSGALRA